MYEKRNMWATAHLQGKFFASFRTASYCKGLHSLLSKHVKSRYSLTKFVEHFDHCLDHMWHKEDEANFSCVHGEPMMQMHLQQLERFASTMYTWEIFFLFSPMLYRASTTKVIHGQETSSAVIYVLTKDYNANISWHVSFYKDIMELKCSCLRMESSSIPCDHIIAVSVFLDISELSNL